MRVIEPICGGFDVAPLREQLTAHPDVWNRHTLRTQGFSPHRDVSDIWVRYDAWERVAAGRSDPYAEHGSVWYPCIREIPAAWSLARKVFRRVHGKRLGGVLITRIPPGGEVKPHKDTGWHAGFYEKFAVQVASNEGQAFCFESDELRPMPGDLYTFQNHVLHWVTNPTPEERITMIVCVKR